MSRSTRNPTSWAEYQYGVSPSGSRGSMSSTGGRSVQFDEGDLGARASVSSVNPDGSPDGERHGSEAGRELRRRRSSVALRLNAIAQVGGVNSIANFARSWQRAAGFHEVAPHRPSFVFYSDDETGEDETGEGYARQDIEAVQRTERTSLLRQHLEASPVDDAAVEDDEDDDYGPVARTANRHRLGSDSTTPKPLLETEAAKYRLGSESSSGQRNQSIFAANPLLVTELAGSYGTSYGTLRSTRRDSMALAGQVWRQQQEIETLPEGEREPLIVKEVEQDGKVVLAIAGQSTLPQTVFNATNVLIGVGLLSLPLGIKYAGLICGTLFLFFSAFVTAYTAKLLAKCLDMDASLITFADLAFISYGRRARFVTGMLFMLELLAACVALVVLFADTLNLLLPGVAVTEWKILCGLLLIPLNFVPLRLLSFTSVLGIFSCFCIVLIIFIDGFIKPYTPGSLREPAKLYWFPDNLLALPLSFGILMSPWGGHSVFPSIYRDMRHPQKFAKGVKITFTFTYVLDAATAMAGILMFGDDVRNEVTANIIGTRGYPKALSILMTVFIAIIPLTKLPLNTRPIVSIIETFTGLNSRAISESQSLTGLTKWTRGVMNIIIRLTIIIILVVIAIIFPSFDSIMAFMGSALCFTICVILPLLFHLKLFGKKVDALERWINYILIAICSILATLGTVFAFLPKSMIGAE